MAKNVAGCLSFVFAIEKNTPPERPIRLPVLRTLSLCTCCRHYPGAAAGRILCSSQPAISAFPERVSRVGLHIVLFEIP